MLRFGKGRTARGARRAGLLVGALSVALGIGGIGASGAAAAPSCAGASITAEGASLQKVAQTQIWSPGFTAICPGVTVTYNGNGSATGLAAWDFNNETTFDHTRAFTASDDGPTSAQIANAEAAAGGESPLMVIPVAQTAISVAVNPPANCELEEITNKQLESIFRGNIKTWGKIDTAFGEGCAGAPITRVVRKDGSGTTYQFKNYLSTINTAALPCTEPSSTWAQLRPISTESKPNISWPENGVGGCSATQLSPVVRAAGNGGGELVKKVNTTDGSIGYAALPDVELNKTSETHTLRIQNNGLVKLANANFAEPSIESNQSANCAKAEYTVPAAARVGSGTGLSADWSQVFGAKNNIGGEAYPLCTITYDMAFKSYSKAGFTEGQEITVHDYLTEYVTASTGQSALQGGKKFYTALPTSLNPAHDVRGASQLAASLIGF